MFQSIIMLSKVYGGNMEVLKPIIIEILIRVKISKLGSKGIDKSNRIYLEFPYFYPQSISIMI